MRRLLGSLLPVVLLVTVVAAGCGTDKAGSAADDSTATPGTTAPTKGGTHVDFQLVQLLTETAAGGALSEVGVPLGDDAAVQEFNAQFETDVLPHRVQSAVAETEVPDGMVLYGAVVAIGCDAPTEVNVTEGASGPVITAGKVPNPMQECFAPMTTVALVLVPA